MILTQCPVCAAELPPLSAKQCSRCKTRYCGAACQKLHWKGGHKALCPQIDRGGGAEQYHADTKDTAAVVVAAEACAEDTKGQTCYICLEAVHPRTGEGLVRGCACGDRDGVASGRTGIAHVACLAEQAKILYAEAEENNLGSDAFNVRWRRWAICGLCEQNYHGVVKCALGWACWKTYLGRTDQVRDMAMNLLGSGLFASDHHEDAVSVMEAQLATMRRAGDSEERILVVQSNLACAYESLGRLQDGLRIRQDVYSRRLEMLGDENKHTLQTAYNYATTLKDLRRFEEARSLLRKVMPVVRRALGDNHDNTLRMRQSYAEALYLDAGATLYDLREAVTTLEEIEPTARRVLGGGHPTTQGIEKSLRDARAVLRAREPK